MLDDLLQQVQKAVTDHTDEQNKNPTRAYDPHPLLSALQNLFSSHQAADKRGGTRPASEDPHGDPADQGPSSNVRSAKDDPYGDPADQGPSSNIRPAKDDPYGDPADQEVKRKR